MTLKRVVCVVRGHRPKVQSMTRSRTWYDAPSYPIEWAGTVKSVRSICARCGKVLS